MFNFVQDFFELRRLRRDLRIADSTHMQQLDQISQLERRVTELEGDLTVAKKATSIERGKVTKLRKQVRDQTGADLLVNALRELGVIPKPTKDYDAHAEAGCLQGQLNAQNRALANTAHPMQQQMGRGGLGGLLG